jgi:hypothetical protein
MKKNVCSLEMDNPQLSSKLRRDKNEFKDNHNNKYNIKWVLYIV